MKLTFALPKNGHPNCRRPDKVIDGGHSFILNVKIIIATHSKFKRASLIWLTDVTRLIKKTASSPKSFIGDL